MPTISPRHDLATLAQWGTDNLTRVIAIDSQSDEASAAIPSTLGQRNLSDFLRGYFDDLGYPAEQDDFANLLVFIPGNTEPSAEVPAVALMVHMDTAEGTQAVPALECTPAWDGSRVPYPQNDRLTVTAERYPETACFLGDDLLHGPGRFPIGLDDKLGMAELMTLARVLAENPDIPHGPLVLVFRPDEEIGRMAAVDGLADELAQRGVRYGYTIDGILPFEINVENFNAAAAQVLFGGQPLALAEAACARAVTVSMVGVNTHGATAKPEGHLNSVVSAARALATLGQRDDIVPIGIACDPALECNARLRLLVRGADEAALDAGEQTLLDALWAEIEPHAWKGAAVEITDRAPAPADGAGETDAARRLMAHVAHFLATGGVSPLLPEDSDGDQGYSNPCFVDRSGGGLELSYRLRDFDPNGLERRERHLRRVCETDPDGPLPVAVVAQYVNMGPTLSAYPELVEWAGQALREIGREPDNRPIRGGTGVDPFLARDIPIANLGTGYFAPESEKELTSRQNIARHTLWLTHLVQVIAQASLKE
ncbi:M20/M25/M40 family metallo-hydrolase [Haliangium sp.]|uniref:M20/M25/M40 family metallo-hydrolase n=1 Tax=Haliangium sp. TaxID=2663208 RepID=UPI003D0FED11